MKIATASDMRLIDERTIAEYGIPGKVLMQRAGQAAAKRLIEIFGRGRVVVIAGGGNNGGDGIVAAKMLFKKGFKPKVYLMQDKKRLSPDCLIQYRAAEHIGVPIEFRNSISDKDINGFVVIDALLGTGINKPVTSPLSDVIECLNRSSSKILSIDIPSGISSDNGRIMGAAVRADATVTFGLPKIGHFLHPGAEYTGRLFIEDIGFPKELLNSVGVKTEAIEKSYASGLLPERPAYSYKGDYGHVMIVAGSKGKTGAALMAARACLRAGAGMVTLGVPESLMNVFQTLVTEEMVLPLPDNGEGILSGSASSVILDYLDSKADILAIGPGISTDTRIRKLLKQLLSSVSAPMVLDADAINVLEGQTSLLNKVKAPIVLTPHIGEMARMMSGSVLTDKNNVAMKVFMRKIEENRINRALSFSKETGTYLVLKGAPTIIAEPEGRCFINRTGNPGMATAGSGDVLTGMLAAFLGQGLNPLEASVLGIYLHGLSGDIAAAEKGMHSLIASDIIEKLPEAIMCLTKDA